MNGYEKLRYWNEPDYSRQGRVIDWVIRVASYGVVVFSLLCIMLIIYTSMVIFFQSLKGG